MVRPYYTTYSAYSKRTACGYPGKQYMELSREALREDDMVVILRKSRLSLENLIKKRNKRFK